MAEAVQTPMKNTVDENEISHFDKLAKEFWDEKGAIKGLLAMNKLRVPFIRDGLLGMKQANEATDKEPLEGYQILDVGCGAGILSEPLARIGANVTGIDPGGSVFITTPNRSVIMWIFGIFLFEYVFRILPIGTHHLDKCIRPHELQALLEKNDCSTKLIRGIIYNLLNNEWYWSPMKSAVYALHAVKRR